MSILKIQLSVQSLSHAFNPENVLKLIFNFKKNNKKKRPKNVASTSIVVACYLFPLWSTLARFWC